MQDLNQQDDFLLATPSRGRVRFFISVNVGILLVLLFAGSLFFAFSVNQYKTRKINELTAFQVQKLNVLEARLEAVLKSLGSVSVNTGVATSFPVQNQSELFERFWEGGEEFTYVTDRNGKLISSNSHTYSDANLSRAIDSTAKRFAPAAQGNSIMLEKSAFEYSVVAFKPIAGTDFVIFVESNAGGRLGLVKPIFGDLVFAFALTVFLAFIFGEILSARFSKYLADKVAVLDDLKIRLPSQDPIPLSQEFNLLGSNIRSLSAFLGREVDRAQKNERAKVDAEKLLKFVGMSPGNAIIHREVALFLSNIIDTKLKLSVSFHRVSLKDVDFSVDENRGIFDRTELLSVGVARTSPFCESISFDEALAKKLLHFSESSKPELISESLALFPVFCDEKQKLYLLVSGSKVRSLTNEEIGWVDFACDVYRLSFGTNPGTELDQFVG